MIRLLTKIPSPDKGWSCWVMFFCTCVNTFLVFGVHYTYGILYPSVLLEFNQGEGKTAWVGSLASGLLFLSSMAAIKCCEVASVTTTCVIGSILSGAGLILTSVIKDFSWLYLVYGVLFGVGSSFLYTPSLIMIAKWFDKYQTLTTGIATASGALGAVVLSPLIQYVVTVKGLRQTIKLAGIVYITVSFVCSLSYRTLERSSEDEEVQEVIKTTTTLTTPQPTTSENTLILTQEVETAVTGEDETPLRNRSKKGINPFRINCKLFKSKTYMMFILIMMVTNFTYYIPVIHLVNYVEQQLHISQSSASLLISIWSISNIVGRIFFGKFVGIYRKHILRVYQIAMIGSGIVTLATFFSTKYWMVVAYVIIYGFLDGSFIGILSLVTLEIVGMDNLAQGFGVMLTSIGLPVALGPLLIGIINDKKVLPPKIMFLLAGAPFIIGAILMTPIIKWKNTENAHRGESDEEEHILEESSKEISSDNTSSILLSNCQ